MDAPLDAQELISEARRLLGVPDYNGTEELLAAALGRPELEGFAALFHFEFARLYGIWNKLSSAIHHLNRAVDLLSAGRGERLMLIVVLEERKSLLERQVEQRP